mgnify:CR=1 FL=1
MPKLSDLDFASVSETKADLSALLKRLHETKRILAVTSHGKPAGILMDFEEYQRIHQALEEMEAMEATLEVMNDPEMLAGLKKAIAEDVPGARTHTFEEVFGEPLLPRSRTTRK